MKIQVPERDRTPFRAWVLKRLDENEDAAELADFICVLVDMEDDEQAFRTKCHQELEYFLQGKTKDFVNVLVAGIKNNTYMIGAKTPPGPKAPTWNGPATAAASAPATAPIPSVVGGDGKRKRANEATENARPSKQSKLHNIGNLQPPRAPAAFGKQPPRGPRGKKLRGAAASHAMGNGAASLANGADLSAAAGLSQNNTMLPCLSYILNGVCSLGVECLFAHPYAEQRQHDGAYIRPHIPNLPTVDVSKFLKGNPRRGRSDLAATGNSHDQGNSTLVIERIPKEYLSSQAVLDAFEPFGTITNIEMHKQDRLAVLTYETHSMARAAYMSPIPLFNNRFVKVFWRKTDEPLNITQEAEPFDAEVFAIKTKEAQEKFERRRRRQVELDAQRTELASMSQRFQEQARELKKLVAARERKRKAGGASPTADETQQLRDTLEDLKQLAKAEGIDPNNINMSSPLRGLGRSLGSRGRNGAGAGAGGSSSSSYARTAWDGARRTGVKRLDNRPKCILITPLSTENLTADSMDEFMRSFLLTEDLLYESMENIDGSDSASLERIVTFRERYLAESMVTAIVTKGSSIPEIGSVSLKWVSGHDAIANGVLAEEDRNGGGGGGGARLEVSDDGGDGGDEDEDAFNRRQVKDLDVADDEDNAWMY